MTKQSKGRLPDHLRSLDRVVMGILSETSDAELLKDSADEGVDLAKVVQDGRQAFERAQQIVGRSRLAEIKKEMEKSRNGKVMAFDRDTARRQYNQILKRNAAAASKLTIAARNHDGTDDESDLDGMLEDFAELGLIKEGNEGGDD